MKAPPVTSLLMFASALAMPVQAADPQPSPAVEIELSASASRQAPNDLARASAYAEATGANPEEVARRVNETIRAGIATAKRHAAVKVRSGSTHTYPIYAKGGAKVEGWRMRSELLLESQDMQALSDVLGKLQSSMGVSQLSLLPAPETRRQVEDQATVEAIAAFRAKAKLVADAFGKSYRIRQMSVGDTARPPMPVMRGMVAEAASAAPIEAGESAVTVTVTGRIELAGD